MGLLVVDVGHRAETEVFVDQAFHDGVVFGQGDVHLDGALRMPDVVNFLLGLVRDISECRRDIIIRHILECKFPEGRILLRIIFGVIQGVFIPSAIAQPHIISMIGQDEPWGPRFIIDQPRIRTIQQPMLQIDRGEAQFPDCGVLFLNTVEGVDVAIVTLYVVDFDWVVEVFAVVEDL